MEGINTKLTQYSGLRRIFTVKSAYDIAGGDPEVSPTTMDVLRMVHSMVPPAMPVSGTLNSDLLPVGGVMSTAALAR